MSAVGMHNTQGSKYWSFDTSTQKFKYSWRQILPLAADIVRENNEAGFGITLRQLFYRLVAVEALPNTQRAYNSLSVQTAKYRRKGRFPALIDQGRSIHRPLSWQTAKNAAEWINKQFRVNRAEGQPYLIYIVAEKHGMFAQLTTWFSQERGIPVITLGGYASQTLKDDVAYDVWLRTTEPAEGMHAARRRTGVESVLIYAGDFDASGEDIPRDFIERTNCWDHVVTVGLNPDQIEEFKLPPQPGKESDARAAKFAEKYMDLFQRVYGMNLVQIELDALPPETLKKIFADEVEKWWDDEPYQAALQLEERQQYELDGMAKMLYYPRWPGKNDGD